MLRYGESLYSQFPGNQPISHQEATICEQFWTAPHILNIVDGTMYEDLQIALKHGLSDHVNAVFATCVITFSIVLPVVFPIWKDGNFSHNICLPPYTWPHHPHIFTPFKMDWGLTKINFWNYLVQAMQWATVDDRLTHLWACYHTWLCHWLVHKVILQILSEGLWL